MSQEVKLTLRVVIGGDYDGDTDVILTTQPGRDLNRWLYEKFSMSLADFTFVQNLNHGEPHGRLECKESPKVSVLLSTFHVVPANPVNVLAFKGYHTARMSMSKAS